MYRKEEKKRHGRFKLTRLIWDEKVLTHHSKLDLIQDNLILILFADLRV